jgi:hypothetical protein
MLFKKFWEHIEKSILGGVSNKVSTTRISSYLILGSILTTTAIYLLTDIVNAIIKWYDGEIFIISKESLIFFGMILTHHLALLGINKNAETKQYTDLVKLSNEKSNSSKKETEDTEETQETTDENELEEPSSSVELKKNKKK